MTPARIYSNSGTLQPPRDVSGMVRSLIDKGYVNVLGEQRARIPFERDDAAILEQPPPAAGRVIARAA